MNDAELTDEYLNNTGLTKLGQIHSAGFSDRCFMMGCCAAIRRELLDLCLPIPASQKAHDNWIIGIADGLGRKHILPEVLQYYRRHGGNQSLWIVNRTTPVTRWHVRVEQMRALLHQFVRRRPVFGHSDQLSLTAQHYMLTWAIEAEQLAPDWLNPDIASFKISLEQQLNLKNKRYSIRALPLLLRVRRVFGLWSCGGYSASFGIVSAMRDILLPNC